MSRVGEAVIGAAGTAAGVLAEPRQGLARLRSALTGRRLATVAAGLVAGYVLGRAGRRA